MDFVTRCGSAAPARSALGVHAGNAASSNTLITALAVRPPDASAGPDQGMNLKPGAAQAALFKQCVPHLPLC